MRVHRVGLYNARMEHRAFIQAHLDAMAISAYCSARRKRARIKMQEPLISINPQVAYLYALKVVGGRFKMGERCIARSPEWAVRYARFVLKGRFRIAERKISKSTEWSYEYATKVIKGRLPPDMHSQVAEHVGDRFADKYLAFQLESEVDFGYNRETPQGEN